MLQYPMLFCTNNAMASPAFEAPVPRRDSPGLAKQNARRSTWRRGLAHAESEQFWHLAKHTMQPALSGNLEKVMHFVYECLS